MALADTANLIVNLRLDDKFSGPLGRANRSLSGLQAGAFQTGKGIGQVGAGLARIGTIAATGFAVGVGAAIKLAGDFESQLNTINTIALVKNPEQLTAIGEGIRKTFRDTGQPLEDLTAAYYDLLSAGVKVGDAQGELNTAVRLGIGGLGSTAEAVDLLTTAQNSYGLSQEGVAHAADIFAKAVEDGKVKISELAATFADVAPVAKTSGVSLEELGASYAFLTAKGVPAADASTQLNRAMIELLKPSPKLIAVQKKLGESFESLIKKKGLVGTFQAIREEAARLGIPFQDLFGRLEGYKFALATTGDSFADFSAEYKKFGDTAGTVDEQFAAKQQGFNFQLDKLKAGLQDAGITIGSALLPKLTPLLDKLNEFIGAHQGDIANFAQKLADGFSAFADAVQKADWGPLLDGLKIAADLSKQVVGLFLSLPPAVQGAVLAGAAVNKLSGGLLGAGVGNIVGGGLKLIFERGSSAANPLWVQSVTGGIGGPGGLPLAAGGLGVGTIALMAGVFGALALAFYASQQVPNDPYQARTGIATPGHGFGPPSEHGRVYDFSDVDTHTALREGLPPLVSEFKKSRATSDELRHLAFVEGQRRASEAAKVLDGLRAQTTGINNITPNDNRNAANLLAKLGQEQADRNAKAAATLDTLRGQANSLIRIAEKNFSPTIAIKVPITQRITAYLSVKQVISATNTYALIREGG